MAKCGWCGCYFEDGYKCSEGVVVGNYRYYSFCSQKCFYEARNREDIETEQKAAAAEAERERREEVSRRVDEYIRAEEKKNIALNENRWKDAEKKERKEEQNRSPEELKILEEKAKSYGYESYSAMQKAISQVKQILKRYNNHYYESYTDNGWIPPKENSKLVRKLFGRAFPAERCLAIVKDGPYGIAFTDSAFYSTLGGVSQISYADIEDIEEVRTNRGNNKKYILTAKNGKKIKVELEGFGTTGKIFCVTWHQHEGYEDDDRYDFGKLLQELAKEGKKNPNVARIKIVANKMTMGGKIFLMVVLSLIAFVIFKCTH